MTFEVKPECQTHNLDMTRCKRYAVAEKVVYLSEDFDYNFAGTIINVCEVHQEKED